MLCVAAVGRLAVDEQRLRTGTPVPCSIVTCFVWLLLIVVLRLSVYRWYSENDS